MPSGEYVCKWVVTRMGPVFYLSDVSAAAVAWTLWFIDLLPQALGFVILCKNVTFCV